MTGDIAKNPFFGTLDEVQPVLAAEAVRSGSPALLVGKQPDVFSVVVPASEGNCNADKNEAALLGVHSLPDPKKGVYKNSFCLSR